MRRWSSSLRGDVLGLEDLHHQVGVVAVDAVEAHAHGGVQDVVVLQVPAEGDAFEAVEEGDEAATPVGVVQVDAVDAGGGEGGGGPLGALAQARQARRVDEAHVAVDRPQVGELGDRGRAEPQTAEEIARRRRHDLDHVGTDAAVLEVEGEVEVRSALVEKSAQRRDVLGQLVEPARRYRTPPTPETNDPVMIEHGHAVGGQPHVALEARHPELQGHPERFDGVLLGAVAGATMSEADRRIEQRRKPLLHETLIVPGMPPIADGYGRVVGCAGAHRGGG